MMINKLKAKFL